VSHSSKPTLQTSALSAFPPQRKADPSEQPSSDRPRPVRGYRVRTLARQRPRRTPLSTQRAHRVKGLILHVTSTAQKQQLSSPAFRKMRKCCRIEQEGPNIGLQESSVPIPKPKQPDLRTKQLEHAPAQAFPDKSPKGKCKVRMP